MLKNWNTIVQKAVICFWYHSSLQSKRKLSLVIVMQLNVVVVACKDFFSFSHWMHQTKCSLGLNLHAKTILGHRKISLCVCMQHT